MWSAKKHLEQNHIKFVPGVNEELAAAAIKGTQWLDRYPKARYDGVFALWYGKHLGVERACEALKVGNYDGSGKHGGVLVVGADDMGGKSSVTAAESEHVFIAGMLPVLGTLFPKKTCATRQEFTERQRVDQQQTREATNLRPYKITDGMGGAEGPR